MSDENSELEPPDPISNSEVKRFSADGSVGFPHVRVGHRQALYQTPRSSRRLGAFFYGFFMYAEINQALESLRRNGALPCTEWPKGAPVAPKDLDLVERRGEWVRVDQVEELDLAYLRRIAKDLSLEVEIEYFPVVGSTNRMLVERAGSEELSNVLLTCDYQHAGRGRRGRNWISPYARNLAFSFGHRSEKALHELGGLSCVVGLAITDALADLGLSNPNVKWPNDVWMEGNKLAGVLVELINSGVGTQVVIGVGLNVALTDAERMQIDQPVIDLVSCGIKRARNDLLIDVVGKVTSYLEHFENNGFAPFIEAFNAVHALHQKQVSVHRAGKNQDPTTLGRVVGLGASGQLLVETIDGVIELLGGEVSLRPAPVDH